MEIRKWQYLRDYIANLDELDEKLKNRGDLGWELVSILQTTETKRVPDENILVPEGWLLLFKQPVE
jgi:vacuolar-type H+-ATPase subunit B/Vma2